MDYESHFFLDLSNFFAKQGYDLFLAKKQFRKESENGFKGVVPSFSIHQGALVLDLHMGIRLDTIEGIVHPFSGHLADFQPDSYTLLLSMGALKGKRFFKLKARNQKEFKALQKEIIAFMESKGFDFLEKYQKPREIISLFEPQEEKYNLFFSNPYLKALRALALARLIQDSENYEPWKESYQDLLRKRLCPPHQMTKFQEYIDFLDKWA